MLKWLVTACLVLASPLAAAEVKVLAFAGSTQDSSLNKKLVREAAKIAGQMGAKVKVIDLRDYEIPFYDADLESSQGMPQSAKRLRQLMKESHAIIIATPEYNGSLSAVLKNAIDWASRSESGQPSRDAFSGKKFAILSASPGGTGGARALGHLRTIIENVGGTVVSTQVSVPNAYQAFNEQGELQDPILKEGLKKEVQELLAK
ncbi:NADPH-dependent FMN reductase [Candidatus Protochlamydia naegleriophila]|uniref:NADPH-dependent FMN reductase n=1 Tax=Candidatus Protochlamydia naegleriophila TaxID=389348 RepID=A0A0U5JEE1_9BACT|nr:NAD(P)H-dependent oxidoreductase [Candidatus Protochlamydia naegleriophila]CUI16134.1 NADPH-dependent FMN reductase [Candidatus Protochlamydia naegleriophila]